MTTAEFVASLDNGFLRFYTADKQPVATCLFGNPAFREEGGKYVGVLAPDENPRGGTIAYAMFQAGPAGNAAITKVAVGLPTSNALLKLSRLDVKRGETFALPPIQFDMQNQNEVDAFIESIIKKTGAVGVVTTTRRDKEVTGKVPETYDAMTHLVWESLRDLGPCKADVVAEYLGMDVDDVVVHFNDLWNQGCIRNAI